MVDGKAGRENRKIGLLAIQLEVMILYPGCDVIETFRDLSRGLGDIRR